MYKRILLIAMIMILAIFSLTGCGILDKILSIKDDFKQEEKKKLNEQSLELQEEVGEIIVETPDLESALNAEELGETTKVLLYFASADSDNLVPVETEISKVEGIGRRTIETLLQGPNLESDLVSAVPLGTSLLDINVREDGLCIVDFSQELITNLSGGKKGEELAVYSIVNTLCQFETVERVEFRIEGQKTDSLLGHLNLKEAVTANSRVVE